MQRRGFALVELVIVIAIILLLAAVSMKVLAAAKHKARVVVATGQISSLAKALEDVKDDTGFYPTFLTDLLRQDRPALMPGAWSGPYVSAITLDPWMSPYYYLVEPKTLGTGSFPFDRLSGKPFLDSAVVPAPPETVGADPPMPLIIRAENYGITACDIWVNGHLVFEEKQLRRNPQPQILETTLDDVRVENIVLAKGRSKPGEVIQICIYQGQPTNTPFTLGSCACDRQRGGYQDGRDVEWYSGSYPHFR